MSTWIPVTPGGSVLAHLERNTEDEAWAALMKEAAHMPYPDKQAFIDRGYEVCEGEYEDEYENDKAFAEDWDRELLGDDFDLLRDHDIGNK